MGIGNCRRKACSFVIPVPLTALAKIIGTIARGDKANCCVVLSAS